MSILTSVISYPAIRYRIWKRGDWIQTYTGIKFYPLDPKVFDISIYDIAHALSLTCRWNGHCLKFYSVAEHSVRVMRCLKECSPKIRLAALLHDASEAYICDLVRPVKKDRRFRAYRKIEDRLMRVIFDRFDLLYPLPQEIHDADDLLLGTEARDLIFKSEKPWHHSLPKLPEKIVPWSPLEAEDAFISAYYQIIEEMTDGFTKDLNSSHIFYT